MGTISDRRQIATLLRHHGPVILLRDADAAGVSRAVVRRMFDRGELIRLAKSAFAPSEPYDAAVSWEKFRLRSIAFALSAQDGTFLCGASAAAVLDLPMISDPPELPTALRSGSAHVGHNLSPYGTVRHGYLPPHHRTSRNGVPVVSPAYCAIDVARHAGSRDGLAVADKVLHLGTNREVLAALAVQLDQYPGIGEARWVVEHADARAESPLETLGRFAFLSAGLSAPLSNVWIPVGRRWYRVDHLLPDCGVILEADGAIKYDNRPDAARQVVQDRQRENELRSLTFGLDRYTWATAEHRPAELLYRSRQAARRRGTSPPPTCWTLDAPPGWAPDHRAGWAAQPSALSNVATVGTE